MATGSGIPGPQRTPRANASGLRRDLQLLEALADVASAGPGSGPGSGPGTAGVSGLAATVGREKSQVSRALAALAEEGLVARDEASREYRLGWRLYALAARTFEARLLDVGRPVLRDVVARVEETTVLCVLRGTRVVTVASESPPHAFRGLGWEGVAVPAAATSAGRVLLLDWREETVRAWFTPDRLAGDGAHPRFATCEALLAELDRIRERGFATVDEEFEDGVVGCSAPVRDAAGAVVAALNITAPKGRFGTRLEAAGRFLAREAAALSGALLAPDGRTVEGR